MNYKPDEATLISYFYGELDSAMKEKVELYLSQNPDEKKRMEEWTFTKNVLAGLPEKEVIAPPVFFEETKPIPFWREKAFRIPLGIAASLLFLLVAARILGLSATYSKGELTLGFGLSKNNATLASGTVTEDRVNEMIQASLVSNNEKVLNSWNENRQSMEQSIQDKLNVNSERIDWFIQQTSSRNQEQVRKFLTQIQKDNATMLRDYMQLSAEGQKVYIEGLLTDYSKYLQEQRKQDLQTFQSRIDNMEENTDQFKQETSQILASLIGTGNTTGNSNTRRY